MGSVQSISLIGDTDLPTLVSKAASKSGQPRCRGYATIQASFLCQYKSGNLTVSVRMSDCMQGIKPCECKGKGH